jgi:hypothetical protein
MKRSVILFILFFSAPAYSSTYAIKYSDSIIADKSIRVTDSIIADETWRFVGVCSSAINYTSVRFTDSIIADLSIRFTSSIIADRDICITNPDSLPDWLIRILREL